MYFDGTVNVHGNLIGAILISQTGIHFSVPCFNNMAKDKAYIAGHKAALDMNVRDQQVYKDSILIDSQYMGEWG